MTFEELKETIDFLRENGVIHYKKGDLELLLVEKPVKPEADAPRRSEPLVAAPRGQDGLTAEEQLETYGRVLDAPEK